MKKESLIRKRPVDSIKSATRALIGVMPQGVQQRILSNQFLRSFYKRSAQNYRNLKGYIKPYKSARVFVRKGLDRMEFFSILNERRIEYVLLRWWKDLPEIPEGEDMDILIRDEHRDLVADLLTFTDNGTGLKCDIYTVTGCNYGSHKGIPYFQSNLAHELLATRTEYRGAYVPSPKLYFASLAYHALFHKGYTSGLAGFDKKTANIEHDYAKVLKEQMQLLNLKLKLDAQSVFNWLSDEDFAPAEDTLSKLAEIRPELSFLQEKLHCDIRGGELMVYVIRERLVKDGILQNFTSFLQEHFQFDIIDVKMLSDAEKERCTRHIRGGKWDKGPFRYSGGNPEAFVIAYDYHPFPLSNEEMKKQSRMTNANNLHAKYTFRDLISTKLVAKKSHYNGVHSADNEHDSWFYISLLDDSYHEEIFSEVEKRRECYGTSWSVKKLLSRTAISKTELIKYGDGLAVKKTFRFGKERFLKRERYAFKRLSRELDFIPPLLEEGENYLIIPYLENILDDLNETDRKRVLRSKIHEIIEVIHSMYTRGFFYAGFNPDNIIVTPEYRLYCTGFSYLQRYYNFPSNIDHSYEVAGVPKDYKGDLPSDLNGQASFQEVWEPAIGPWAEALQSVHGSVQYKNQSL